MANHKSAMKRHRQSLVRRARNRAVKTRVKNVIKDLRTAIDANDTERAATVLKEATSIIDRASTKGVLHSRTAARKISRLAMAVNKMQA